MPDRPAVPAPSTTYTYDARVSSSSEAASRSGPDEDSGRCAPSVRSGDALEAGKGAVTPDAPPAAAVPAPGADPVYDVLRDLRDVFYPQMDNYERARVRRVLGEDRGHSEEQCVRCGWRMGQPPLNCNNDDTPHVFPSQLGGTS